MPCPMLSSRLCNAEPGRFAVRIAPSNTTTNALIARRPATLVSRRCCTRVLIPAGGVCFQQRDEVTIGELRHEQSPCSYGFSKKEGNAPRGEREAGTENGRHCGGRRLGAAFGRIGRLGGRVARARD